MDEPTYLHLLPGFVPPQLPRDRYFKAIVVVEDDVTPAWCDTVSDWLVHGGCRYMMAWGRECSVWDDSIDHANLRQFDYGNIPDDDCVMTTWHENDSLREVFCFSVLWAQHPTLDLGETCIVHIAPNERSTEILKEFREAQKACRNAKP